MCARRLGDDQWVTYDDRISIPTPEGVELELVLAGVGSRLVATIVDFLIKMAVLFALVLVGGAVGGEEAGGFVAGVVIVASFLVFFGYDVAFETLASGRTPGKRLNGLRVVRTRGGGESRRAPHTALSSHHRDNDRHANLLRSSDSYAKRAVLNLEIDGHDVIAQVDAEPRDVDVTIVLLVGLELGTVRKRNRKARVVRTW